MLHYEWAGLDNGLSLLRDFETGSIWNHITGEAVHGPLDGERLDAYNLLQTTVEAALTAYPDIDVAISDRPMRDMEQSILERIPVLGPRLRGTMAPEDARRPQMELGLGVWSDDEQRYYPFDAVRQAAEPIVDSFGGRGVIVYIDPISGGPASWYTEAESAEWDEDTIRLSDGTLIRDGGVFDAAGGRLDVERPMQLFTRWYGFALTFPETTIYSR